MTSRIPRLGFDELPEAIATRLRSKVERLGYLGEFFARTAHQEDALAAFIDFTESARGELSEGLVELIALTVSQNMGVEYERNQHERLSVKLGLGRDWVEAVETLDPDGPASSRLSHEQRLVQRFLLVALETGGKSAAAALTEMADALGIENSLSVMMLMARYVGHALMVNSLQIAAPVPSIFEDGFGQEEGGPDAESGSGTAREPGL